MGGGYYERDDIQPNNVQAQHNVNQVNQEQGNDYVRESVGKAESLHPTLDPKNWTKDKYLVSKVKNPIVFALDVTGSMGEWTKVNIF